MRNIYRTIKQEINKLSPMVRVLRCANRVATAKPHYGPLIVRTLINYSYIVCHSFFFQCERKIEVASSATLMVRKKKRNQHNNYHQRFLSKTESDFTVALYNEWHCMCWPQSRDAKVFANDTKARICVRRDRRNAKALYLTRCGERKQCFNLIPVN